MLEDFTAGDAAAVYLLLTREWWVVPMLNPDGYARLLAAAAAAAFAAAAFAFAAAAFVAAAVPQQ